MPATLHGIGDDATHVETLDSLLHHADHANLSSLELTPYKMLLRYQRIHRPPLSTLSAERPENRNRYTRSTVQNHAPCVKFRVKRHVIYYFRVSQNKPPVHYSVVMRTISFSQDCEELRPLILLIKTKLIITKIQNNKVVK